MDKYFWLGTERDFTMQMFAPLTGMCFQESVVTTAAKNASIKVIRSRSRSQCRNQVSCYLGINRNCFTYLIYPDQLNLNLTEVKMTRMGSLHVTCRHYALHETFEEGGWTSVVCLCHVTNAVSWMDTYHLTEFQNSDIFSVMCIHAKYGFLLVQPIKEFMVITGILDSICKFLNFYQQWGVEPFYMTKLHSMLYTKATSLIEKFEKQTY